MPNTETRPRHFTRCFTESDAPSPVYSVSVALHLRHNTAAEKVDRDCHLPMCCLSATSRGEQSVIPEPVPPMAESSHSSSHDKEPVARWRSPPGNAHPNGSLACSILGWCHTHVVCTHVSLSSCPAHFPQDGQPIGSPMAR